MGSGGEDDFPARFEAVLSHGFKKTFRMVDVVNHFFEKDFIEPLSRDVGPLCRVDALRIAVDRAREHRRRRVDDCQLQASAL